MGSYDRVMVRCDCGAEVEFQSKAGECMFHEYTVYNAHPTIIGSLHGDEEKCRSCGATLEIHVGTIVSIRVYPPKSKGGSYGDHRDV
jgi:hypothetical protein